MYHETHNLDQVNTPAYLQAGDNQGGQTLIETIVAIFVLTTALTTGLGLAIYALGASSLSQNEITATNLAREGVEVVRMMRDSNWLAGDVAGGGYALQTCADIANAQCYPQVLAGPTYNISIAGSFRLIFDNLGNNWSLGPGNNNYNLYLQADKTYTHVSAGTSIYARKIVISFNSASPYTLQNREMIIQSIVGWRGKNCTPITNQDPSTTNCKVIVEEHLTNWKDYR